MTNMIVPGRIQTWRSRRGSAKCRGHQKMRAGYSLCCAHETLLVFSVRWEECCKCVLPQRQTSEMGVAHWPARCWDPGRRNRVRSPKPRLWREYTPTAGTGFSPHCAAKCTNTSLDMQNGACMKKWKVWTHLHNDVEGKVEQQVADGDGQQVGSKVIGPLYKTVGSSAERTWHHPHQCSPTMDRFNIRYFHGVMQAYYAVWTVEQAESDFLFHEVEGSFTQLSIYSN